MSTKSKIIRQPPSLDCAISEAMKAWLDEGYQVHGIEANWQRRLVFEPDDVYQYDDVLVVAKTSKL